VLDYTKLFCGDLLGPQDHNSARVEDSAFDPRMLNHNTRLPKAFVQRMAGRIGICRVNAPLYEDPHHEKHHQRYPHAMHGQTPICFG
jgi:hypothetical protein